MTLSRVVAAAHHESAHAVAAVVGGLPILDAGIHIDTRGGGICCNLHRIPGDRSNTPADQCERERSIVLIKAGFLANRRLDPTCAPELGADDRVEEVALLNEMHSPTRAEWHEADRLLTEKAQATVDRYWDVIQSVASALLAKPVTVRTLSLRKWKSEGDRERWISGREIATILKQFQLEAIVRSEAQGLYYPPDLHCTPEVR